MSEDNFNITIQGVSGKGGGSSSAPKLDVSALQKAVNEAANQLKKMNTSQFQKNLEDLSGSIKASARSANSFVDAMQKAETRFNAAIKSLQFASKNMNNTSRGYGRAEVGRFGTRNNFNEAGNLIKSVSSLKDSIDKLNSSMKDGFKVFKNESDKSKPKEEKEKTTSEKNTNSLKESVDNLSSTLKDTQKTSKEGGGAPPKEPEKEDRSKLMGDVKKLLAAVGIGSIARQIAENEIITPARTTGMLIGSNVVANTQQAGSEAIQSYQNRQAGVTQSISSAIGGVLGGLLGSVVPGLGTAIGAGIGYGAGNLIGGTIGESSAAKEAPTLQRGLTTSFYSNIANQQSQFGAFANSQYGEKGFGGAEAFRDPYMESKAILGRSFSRFAGGNLDSGATTNILKSLTAQGASSPQELNMTGNLLGQIARYTGKSSLDIEKLYKNVERSGMNPNEGLQKTLSLLQSGMSPGDAEKILQRTSQRSEAFEGGQNSYFNASPFQQFMSQQVGKVTGIDTEKFFSGDEKSINEARRVFKSSRETLSKGGFNDDVVKAELLNRQGITSAMTDKNLNVPRRGEESGYFKLSAPQEKIIETQNKAIIEGAKGRGPDEIVDKALTEIGKSTESFSVLGTAASALGDGFKELKKSVSDMVDSIGNFFTGSNNSTGTSSSTMNKPYTMTPSGR